MGKIISFANHKGGVAKTTSVASLGVALARMGKRVLLIDFDPQTNLTGSLTQEEPEETVLDSLRNGTPLPRIHLRDGLDLCPGSLDLVSVDSGLETPRGGQSALSRLLNGLEYDYVFIDCPPSLARLTQTALSASTEVIIPLTPEALPAKGVGTILQVIDLVKGSANPTLSLGGFIITRYRRRKIDRIVEESLRESFGDLVFKTKIRENVDLSESPLSGTDIYTYAPNSNGAKDYSDLATEIVSKLK